MSTSLALKCSNIKYQLNELCAEFDEELKFKKKQMNITSLLTI
jgi:hypothetical protein